MSSQLLIRVSIFAVLAVAVGIMLVRFLGEPRGGAVEPPPSRSQQPASEQQPVPTFEAMSRVQTAALRAALSTPVVAAQPELLEGPMEVLPPDTVAAIIVPSWSETSQLMDMPGLLDQFRDKLTKFDDTLADCGIDMTELLDPQTLGIDPHGPVVFAWLDVRETTALVGFRVQDSALFEQALGNILTYSAENSGKQFHTEQQGDALITFDAPQSAQVAVIRRPGVAFVAIHDSWRGDVETAAAQVAWQDPADSLTTTDIWSDTMYDVHGRHGLLFVNFPAIAQQAAFAFEQDQKEWVEAEYGDQDEAYLEMQRNRTDAVRNLLEAVVGSLHGFGAAIDVSGPRVDLDARLLLAVDSFLDGFVVNRSMLSPLQRAFTDKPTFWIDGALDPGKFRELVRMMAMLGGGDPDEAIRMGAAALGIDGNPLDLLDGRLGFALFPPSDTEPRSEWGFTATIGIGDMERGRMAFERAAAMASVALKPLDDPDEASFESDGRITTFPIPGWQNLYAGLTSDALIVTTDVTVLSRLQNGESTAISSWGIRHEIASVLNSLGEAGSMLIDFGFAKPRNDLPATDNNYSEDPPEGVSAEQRELWMIDRQIDLAHRQNAERTAAPQTLMAETLGAIAATARSEGPALAIRGVWAFGAADAREAAVKLANAAWSLDEVSAHSHDETSKLYQRRWEIQESINTQNAPSAVDPECADPEAGCGYQVQ